MAFDYLANEALRCGRVFTLISSLEHYETHITPSSSILLPAREKEGSLSPAGRG